MAMLDIFFPGPREIDRFAGQRFGDRDGLPCVLLEGTAPSEPATEIDLMDFDIRKRNLRRFCRSGGSRLAVLRGGPHINATIGVERGTVLWLHSRVFQIRRIVSNSLRAKKQRSRREVGLGVTALERVYRGGRGGILARCAP